MHNITTKPIDPSTIRVTDLAPEFRRAQKRERLEYLRGKTYFALVTIAISTLLGAAAGVAVKFLLHL